MNQAQNPAAEAPQRVAVIFSGLLLVMLLAALDSTIVATALPTIVTELGGVDRLAWVITSYLLAQTIVTPLYGKLGDLYGRKGVLQFAIVLFLIGSALCGLSRSMMQLVMFRAIQGLGGGGLISTAQAAIGDVVAVRDRGRYQGIFGGVFGLSSIAGPLLGGFFTTHISWRWIFYINLPFGIAALLVLAATLPARLQRTSHAIDYTGSALLGAALSGIVLITDLGGGHFGWLSPTVVMIAAATVLALGMFIVVERRAREPVLPLRLFRDRTFVLCSVVGMVIGVTLFGSVTYLPLFLQIVKGSSPTGSGLQLAPMMGGNLLASVIAGQLISRHGRYRVFPIAGMIISTLGLFLLSRITTDTTLIALLLYITIVGLGMGMVMQVLIIAVQNAVSYADLGVATSGAMLFRLIGGSLGTAIMGSVFASRLAGNVARAGIHTQSGPAYQAAFTSALTGVFAIAAAVSLAGFALAWFIPETPLRETVAAKAADVGTEAADSFGMPPSSDDSTLELMSGLLLIADRDVKRAYMKSILDRAQVDLTPAAGVMLIRIDADKCVDPQAVAQRYRASADRLAAGVAELRSRGLLDGEHVTPEGCELLGRIVEARRQRLAELSAQWPAGQREQLAVVLNQLARELVPDAPRAA
ncbi:MAG TPA: MDR family MFS transporter [Longimicrobiales bacterium]